RAQSRTKLRLGWPSIPGKDGVEPWSDGMRHNSLELLFRRTRLDREAGQDLPANRVTEDVSSDAVEKKARPCGERVQQARNPAVLPGLAVHQQSPSVVVRRVLLESAGLHDRVPEPEVTRHVAGEPAVQVAVLALEYPSGDRLKVYPSMHQRREYAAAVET